jgi:hypothetical protein
MKKDREKIRKLLSSYVALTMVLTAMVGIISMAPQATAIEEEEGIHVPTLRVYGNASEGAGDLSVCDPLTNEAVEDLPYTDAIAPFDPQHPQAPVKDSITFNPVYLSETESNDELLGQPGLPAGPYDDRIKHSAVDAEEKVHLRQWYEPWHWDKDVDADGRWISGNDGDGDDDDFWDTMAYLQWLRHLPVYQLQGKVPIEFTSPLFNFNETLPFLDPYDEIYEAIMQEYTYLLVEPQYHQPTYGTPGNTFFVFPVGMQPEDIWDPYGYGMTSLDYDFDGEPDTVTVHSEKTIFRDTHIAADFDGSQSIDPIDPDGYELTGDEMVVLTTPVHQINVGDKWQFLDHMIEVVDTYENPASVKLSVYYTGDLEPEWLGYILLGQYDMALLGRKLPATYIKAVENGGTGTNLCDFPTGPWFVWASSVHPDGEYAYLMIGRAVGHSHTAMENGSFEHDLTHQDPWWLKRFYVDGHEYNVVAIETYRRMFEEDYVDTDSWDWTDTEWDRWAANYTFPDDTVKPPHMVNDLDSAWADRIEDTDDDIIEGPPSNTTTDESAFKFITIRTPIPKSGERQNIQTHEIEYAYRDEQYSVQGEDAETVRNWGYYHLIEQHSVRLQPYFVGDYLSVLPPYNYEHTIAKDIQTNWSAMRNDPDDEIPYYGDYYPWGMRQWYDQPWDPDYDPDNGWLVEPQWIGDLLDMRPPITQKPGDYETYDGRIIATEHMMYIEEDINPQYKGELKEIYEDGYYWGDTHEDMPDEWWYVEQFHTLPDMYTEFVLPEGNEHYLLTSAFTSDESYGRILDQEKRGNDIADIFWIPYGNRVKFWFNPMNIDDQIAEGLITEASDLKIYKCEDGLRIYGFDSEGPGDHYNATDPVTSMIPEDKPYTNSNAPFNPQHRQAPPKDSITFNPAYMDEYLNGGEDLSELYKWISIEEADAREKVFHRMWYEPWHWDKDVDADEDKLGRDVPDYDQDGLRETWELIWFLKHYPEYQDLLDWTIPQLKNLEPNPHDLEILDPDDEIYPALMQEFTYMYVNVWDMPDHAQPATSSFAFPIATEFEQLGYWDPVDERFESDDDIGDFGWGLTTFDGNFDGVEDICRVHSEYSLAKFTGIQYDTNGDDRIQQLDIDGNSLSGDEIVILALENVNVDLDDFVMFLDHMIRVDDITADHVTFMGWRTGGSTSEDIYPSKISGSFSLEVGEMQILLHGSFEKKLSPGENNLGAVDGPWFVYLHALDDTYNRAVITVGRALGNTFTAMEDNGGGVDLNPGDPWYMKRFYVDGHEYSTVAVMTHMDDYSSPYKDEKYEFKYITIRTEIPKMPVIIDQHSQRLQNYSPCMDISVMPPFNYEHTARRDIVSGWTECEWWMMPFFDDLFEWDAFMNNEDDSVEDDGDNFVDVKMVGEIIKNKPPLVIHINEETREEQFKGELKEKYNKRPKVNLTADLTFYDVPVGGDFDGQAHFNLGAMYGTLEGRTVRGGMEFYVRRTNDGGNGNGDIYGRWWLSDPDAFDPIFFDNEIFYEDTIGGDIQGTYDHNIGNIILELTCHYADLNFIDFWDFQDITGYLEEWFLCFYAGFDVRATVGLDGANQFRYSTTGGVADGPIHGGWDPADQYPMLPEWVKEIDHEVWMVEQFHTLPDQYTELGLPDDGQLYLLTSSWYAAESKIWEAYLQYPYGYAFNTEFDIDYNKHLGERVKFWYDPGDCEDIYVNSAWIYGEGPGEFDPWDYDSDPKDGVLEEHEVIDAVNDFFALLISYDEVMQVITAYFSQ